MGQDATRRYSRAMAETSAEPDRIDLRTFLETTPLYQEASSHGAPRPSPSVARVRGSLGRHQRSRSRVVRREPTADETLVVRVAAAATGGC
jgi:hypothetical protein